MVGLLRDFDLAEEATQEAFAAAAEGWPRTGPPANPRAWLMTTARNRAIDRIRRERTLERKLPLLDTRMRWKRRSMTARSPTSGSS